MDAAATFNESGADVDFRIEGDSLTHLLFLEGDASSENIALVAVARDWQDMDRGLFIGNCTTAPTSGESGGVFLYAESGSLSRRQPAAAARNWRLAHSPA